MAIQTIERNDLFGRIGKNVGEGLSEQLPKEMDRNRLAAGLQKLSQEKDLSPFQRFAGLASLPGATPQIIQSGSDFLRQQSYLDAVEKQYQNQKTDADKSKSVIPSRYENNQSPKGSLPTLATPEATAESYKTYIPPTEQEERKDAAENFRNNPERYNNNFDEALLERKAITQRNQEIQKAYQNQETIAVNKEEKVKAALDNEASRLGIVPRGEGANFDPKMFQKFESKVLNSMLPKKEGGEGLTQEQAIKKYSGELDESFRKYQDLKSLSPWSPIDFNRRLSSIQKSFEKSGDKQVLFDTLISDYNVSPLYAAHKTYPIKKGDVPTLEKTGKKVAGVLLPPMGEQTFAALKNEMGKTNSPLSIAYDLEKQGQDPRRFIQYLIDNNDDLEVWQNDQLSKNINMFDLKDRWLEAWE